MLRNKGIIGMILGIIVCGSISFAIATNNMIDSSLVSFDKRNVTQYGATKENVQDAIDEIYALYDAKKNSRKRYANGEVVYYNPVTDSGCTGWTTSNSATGYVLNGCMRWFAYQDTGSNTVKLLLDHNTTATKQWYSSNTYKTFYESNIYSELQTLINSKSWNMEIEASNGVQTEGKTILTLIDASDVADIVNYEKINNVNTWDSTNTSNWFYFETAQKSYKTFYNQTSYYSPYWWLYDRTGYGSDDPCTKYGCQKADSSNEGYWTKTNAGSGWHVWLVRFDGGLNYDSVSNTPRGVRPVVIVEKSKLSS